MSTLSSSRRRTSRRAATVLAAVTVLVAPAASAQSAEAGSRRHGPTVCDGVLTGVQRDVEVRRDASCWIRNADVRGKVTVKDGGSLAVDNSRIRGGIDLGGIDSRLAVRESSIGNLTGGTGREPMTGYRRWAMGSGFAYLQKADVGSLQYNGVDTPIDLIVDEVTFRGNVDIPANDVEANEIEVHGAWDSHGSYVGHQVMRFPKIHGPFRMGAAMIAICGGRFWDSVRVGGHGVGFGVDGGDCRGNRVDGTLYVSSNYASHVGGGGGVVAGNVVNGHATGSITSGPKLQGTNNRFRAGASGALSDLQPLTTSYRIDKPDFNRYQAAAQAIRDDASR